MAKFGEQRHWQRKNMPLPIGLNIADVLEIFDARSEI